MTTGARRNLLFGLIGAFLFQTWLVYTDPAGRAAPPLSELASRGQEVWLRHNCQSCHQVYGFGGFLGPDLTNAFQRLTPARLDTMLTEGAGSMPAFELEAADRRAMLAFLEELDRTGVGQARAPDLVSPRDLLVELVDATGTDDDPLTPAEQRGLAVLSEQNCIDCHLPNQASAFGAPDLTTVSTLHDRSSLSALLAAGVPGKAMPRFQLPAYDDAAVHAVLLRLTRHAASITTGFESAARAAEGALLTLPWFEYP